jgi:hypothetical protein
MIHPEFWEFNGGKLWEGWRSAFAGVFAVSAFYTMVDCGEVVVFCVVNVVRRMQGFWVAGKWTGVAMADTISREWDRRLRQDLSILGDEGA